MPDHTRRERLEDLARRVERGLEGDATAAAFGITRQTAADLRSALYVLDAKAQEIAELRGKVEGLDDARADALRLHREKMALFDRLLDLAGAAKTVVDATEQLADGTWMITGDGEALICALASELQRRPDIVLAKLKEGKG